MQLHKWMCALVHKLIGQLMIIGPKSLAHAVIRIESDSVAQAGVPFLISCWSL